MTYTTQAIVLKKIPAGEADAIVILYTRDGGKMRAYAQGVKKEDAKLKGHIEPFSLSMVQFVMGSAGERLTYAQMLESWPALHNDFNCAAVACYMTGLIDRHCLIGEPDSAIWELLASSLAEVAQSQQDNMYGLMKAFEYNLLACLGYKGSRDMQILGTALARPFMMVYNK